MPEGTCPSCGFNQEDWDGRWIEAGFEMWQCPICANVYAQAELEGKN